MEFDGLRIDFQWKHDVHMCTYIQLVSYVLYIYLYDTSCVLQGYHFGGLLHSVH